MEIPNHISSPKISFADKFGKFKRKFLFIFWLITFLVIGKIFAPVFTTLYSISKFQENYFAIDIIDSHAQYSTVNSTPSAWVPLPKISKRIQQAVIASEDGKFFLHPGYDLEQLRGAINDSFVLKKKMRGASTITQQLVKNLYLSKDKTFGRKAQELVMALMVEKYSDKQKILETYLNIIEYGKGLYGIDKATRYYFNKAPISINAREAAFIAMLLPSPIKYSRSFQKKSLSPFAKRMIDSILLKMRQSGDISEDEYQMQLEGRFSWEKGTADDSDMVAEDSEPDPMEDN